VVRIAGIARKLGMVVMLGYRDADQNPSFQGDTTRRPQLSTPTELTQAVQFFAGVGKIINEHGLTNVWVQLNNEHGSNNEATHKAESAAWLNEYMKSLEALRGGGFKGIVVLSESNFGSGSIGNGFGDIWSMSHLISGSKSDPSGEAENYLDKFIKRDRELLGPGGGTNGRLIVDIHTYFLYGDFHVEKVINWYKAKGVPVVFGEFSSENELGTTKEQGFNRPIRLANKFDLGVFYWTYKQPTSSEEQELYTIYKSGSRETYRD
jgi:hypothetical protein